MENILETKRITTRIGHQLVVTDITQRTLPTQVWFANILDAVKIVGFEVKINFEGMEHSGVLEPGEEVAKLLLALEVARMLETYGVEIIGQRRACQCCNGEHDGNN